MKKKLLKKHLNIGIFFEYLPKDTGNFTQSFFNLNQVLDIRNVNSIVFTVDIKVHAYLKEKNIKNILIKANYFDTLYDYILKSSPPFLMILLMRYFGFNYVEKFLSKHNIDLVYFTSQSYLAESLHKINYIFTIYDLAHLDLPEFPDFNKAIFISRYRVFNLILKRAAAVICESEGGYHKLIKEFNLSKKKLFISKLYSPLINKSFLKTYSQKKTNYKNIYLFFPAAFWPHKNHVFLIIAFSKLVKKIPEIRLKFTGIKNEHSKYILDFAKELKVENKIDFLGHITNESLKKYISNSLALVYPSYLWPSNIPPLEGLSNNCPVFVSDNSETRDFLKNSVYYFDNKDPDTLVDKIYKLYKEGRTLEEFESSRRFILDYMNKKSLKNILSEIFEEYKWKRITWK